MVWGMVIYLQKYRVSQTKGWGSKIESEDISFVLSGHSLGWNNIIGPGGLRAPPVVADRSEAGLVFTYFFSSFLFLLFFLFLSTPSAFHLLRGISRA